MELQAAADRLIKLSPSVRVVTVCDRNGKPVFSAHARRVKNVLSAKQSRESLRTAAKSWKMRRAMAGKLGACKYVVAEYGNVKRITMPAGRNHILYVTTTAAFDHNKVIRKVRSFR